MQSVGASAAGSCFLIDHISDAKAKMRPPPAASSKQQLKQKQNGNLKPTASPVLQTAATEDKNSTESKRQLIGIDGYWYDITKFIPHHPGGPVIQQFVGKDATAVFKSMHSKDVLKHFKPVGQYEVSKDDPANEAFAQLHKFFIEQGFFRTNYLWFAMKISVVFILLGITILAILSSNSFLHYFGCGLFLAAFWQQAGFLMHDFMHSSCFHERKVDRCFGIICGTLCVGINSHWWRDEHFVHHALTNTVDYDAGFADPQMYEEIWAQNEKLFPFYKMPLQEKLIKIQHITFLPVCMILGRIAIIIDGFKNERRWYEWVCMLLHNILLFSLLYQLPSWSAMFCVYSVASVIEGILHVQLLISHYSKEFFERKDLCENKCWYRMQVESNINIKNPIWLDWFHGGLNFHIEHHLFPLMPRHRFREASWHVQKLCKELGIQYDQCCWTDAIIRTLRRLKTASHHFSLDPR